MSSEATYAYCRGWSDFASIVEPIECPPRLRYPPPPSRVRVLFVGWNPPGDHHVWEGAVDDLRDNLAWVFEELGWRGQEPDFRKDLLQRGCYFVHAVKCWRSPQSPSFESTRRCSALLAEDIKNLKPKNLCILGKWAHVATSLVMPLPAPGERFKYGKGWTGEVNSMNVIITTFANRRWNSAEKKENRACVADAFRRWVRL